MTWIGSIETGYRGQVCPPGPDGAATMECIGTVLDALRQANNGGKTTYAEGVKRQCNGRHPTTQCNTTNNIDTSGVAAAAGVAATSANGDKPAAPPPPWEGAPATAALFADFLSYRSPRVDGQSRGASEHEAAAAVVAYPALETGGPVAAQE